VSIESTILVGNFDEFCWIRCEDKGNFVNSPLVKEWLEEQMKTGTKVAVVDLQTCSGMDSTFMGNLADFAMKLTAVGGGLQIADASEKCVSLIEDLGLGSLMKLNPQDEVWQPNKDSIREKLEDLDPKSSLNKTQHIYETHKKLCEADSENDSKFRTVLECLEAELANKKK